MVVAQMIFRTYSRVSNRMRRVFVSTIRLLLVIVFLVLFLWTTPIFFRSRVNAGEWLKTDSQSQTWVDTSHWEDVLEWVDTSHWETRSEEVWVESGYWDWVSDYYWAYTLTLIRTDSGIEYVSSEGQIGWSYNREAANRIYVFNVQYIYESPGRWRAVWDAQIYEKNWYMEWYSKPYWVDTSHWELQEKPVWVSSGNWETRKKWVESGYWAEPLHGTITVQKTPSFVFTKWHWLTQDGNWHSYIDERAHVRITISWTCEKPVDGTSHYAEVTRNDDLGSVDRILIATHVFPDGEASGEMQTVTEYEHAGNAKHTFELHALDGSVTKVYFEIPVNGFNGVNTGENSIDSDENEFLRSTRDRETISF